jgi:hypothetical protein
MPLALVPSPGLQKEKERKKMLGKMSSDLATSARGEKSPQNENH